MLLNKEQAARHICPLIVENNCVPDCVSTKCMAWRWFDECPPEDCDKCAHWKLLENRERECLRRGYCGLAGIPKFS